MATHVSTIETLVVELETKPGALGQVYNAFREAGVNVNASWGFERGPGKAQAILYPRDMTKTKDVLTKMKLKFTPGKACYAEGDDKVGCYADLLQKVTAAKVNLHATDAMAIGGKFACAFWTEDKDFPALCRALGC